MKIDYVATVGSIAESSGGVLVYGDPMIRINTITTDSRDLGEKNLFIPIVGERFDGHDFIEGLARENKITAFLTMKKEHGDISKVTDTACIHCDNTLGAYGMIASNHRKAMDATVIGITGTNGKTTTKELLWSVLSGKYKTLKNEKNYNNEIGVPYTLLGLKGDHKMAVIEMGMNHAGEVDRLSRIAEPDIALITNIGEGHLEYLGTVENVANAKAEIINGMKQGGRVFLNRDTEFYGLLTERAWEKGIHCSSFGLSGEADIHPDSYQISEKMIKVSCKGEDFEAPLYGIHNLYNMLAALAVAFELKIEPQLIRESFTKFRSVDMRSQVLYKGYIVINDAYNSNPLSSKYALQSVREIFDKKRKIAVLSDMKELGSSSDIYHRELGREVFLNGFDILCTWGDSAREIAEGARVAGMSDKAVFHFNEKGELVDFIIKNLTLKDVVLVKGSRSMKMEEVVEAIVH